MTPEERLQALLRLKRHEKPPEGHFDEFLKDFQERQRQEILQRGSLSLLRERMETWFDGLRRPAVAWSLAGAYSLALLLVCVWPKPQRSNTFLALLPPQEATTAPGKPDVNAPAPPPGKGARLVSHGGQDAPPVTKTQKMNPEDAEAVTGRPLEDPPKADPADMPGPPTGVLREL